MRTEDLIASLSGDLRAMPRGAATRRVGLGIAGGAIITMALVAGWLGLRPDLGGAMLGFAFWMKAGYTIAVGAIAVLAILHLAHPEATRPRWLGGLAAPAGLLAILAMIELATTPAGDWTALWQGQSWQVCTRNVAILSAPIFAGLIVAFRQLAPTRLRLTGAVAGLAAGGWAATLYGLHCPEVSALFVLIWYSLGMLLATAIGALAGPHLLRW
uniref:NrsF family protein n=1 Tax=uncultured Sphingomonas sp. TaxID=158754 RepID=UPI0035CC87E4